MNNLETRLKVLKGCIDNDGEWTSSAIDDALAEIARLRKGLGIFADDDANKGGFCSWDWTRESLYGRRCGYAWMHPTIENPAAFARDVLEGKA